MKFKVCEYCGAHLDSGEKCDCQETKVLTYADWAAAGDFAAAAKPGDAVEERIVEEFLCCVPPASNRTGYVQCGEPYNHQRDPRTGTWEPTYTTFGKRGKTWYYLGHCFYGDTVEPHYLAGATA